MMATGAETTRKEVVVACEDKYEAQKLANLIFVRDPEGSDSVDADRTYLEAVVNVIETEVVISIGDGSSHSVLLDDEVAVDAFVDFVQSVIDGRHRLIMVHVLGDRRVRIVKDVLKC